MPSDPAIVTAVPKGHHAERRATTLCADDNAARDHAQAPSASAQRIGALSGRRRCTHAASHRWVRSSSGAAGGLRSCGPHVLRHTFCSHLAMRGAPARAIQELAGHRSLRTTMRYMHLSPAALDSALRLLEPTANSQNRGDIVETVHA
jgi:site-specific recombinase XerD